MLFDFYNSIAKPPPGELDFLSIERTIFRFSGEAKSQNFKICPSAATSKHAPMSIIQDKFKNIFFFDTQ